MAEEGIGRAFALVMSGDPQLFGVVGLSLGVTLCAIAVASLLALPVGYLLAHARFPGRRGVITLVQTLTAVPTVVVGLVLYGMLSRHGPMGGLGWLFTPVALVLGQAVLAFPIVATHAHAALKAQDPRILETARGLGAGPLRAGLTLLAEGRVALVAAVITAFGRVVGEVGCAMMVGGNIEGYTRTMSTAIALESGRGAFSFGLGLALVLLTVALGVNLILQRVQGRL